jgi:Abnormal spindle-like microcephaly-assoc'd, ASPM-SPD-2-Hydin/Matrixin
MRRALLLLAGLLLLSADAGAGGPLGATGTVPRRYPAASFPLTYRVDQGTLGTFGNATAQAIAGYAFLQWDNVSSAALSFINGGALARDVTQATDPYIAGNTQFSDGVNPVVFDTDGSITDGKLGVGAKNSVLGFAGSASVGGNYREGYVIINGFLSGAGTLADQDRYRATITHEVGHFLGLGHSQVALHADFATMYPIIVKTAQQTLDPDDTAAIANLYPAAGYTGSVGSITGTVRGANNANLSGVNVLAVSTATGAAYSTLVDYFSGGKPGFDNPPGPTGTYTITGLPPGSYHIRIEPVNANFTGGSGVGSYNTPVNANVSREWYNGSESGDMLTDNTNQQTTVVVGPGAATSGINFIENTSPTLSTLLHHDGMLSVAFPLPHGSVTGYATRFTAPVTGSLVGVRFRLQGSSTLPLTGSLTITVHMNAQGSIAGIPGAPLGSVTVPFRDLVADQDNEVWLRGIGAPINFIAGNQFHVAFTSNGVGSPVFLTDDGNPTQNRSSYQTSGSTWRNFGDGGFSTGYNLIVSAVYSSAVFGTPTPGIAVAPASLSFGTIRPGASVDRTLRVTNSGTAALNVMGTPVLGADSIDYLVVSGGGAFTLAPGAGRDLVVRFAPRRAGGNEGGTKSARLSIVSNADPSPFDVPLVGNAVQPLATRLDTAVNFGSRLVGGTYIIDTAIIHNTCTDTLHISSVALTGPDAGTAIRLLSSAGPAAVPPDGLYRIRIQFTPTERRAYSAMLRVNHDDSTGRTDIPVMGRGIAPVLASSATTLQGGSVRVGRSVTMSPLTISNSGDAPMRVTAIRLTGANAGDYSIANGPTLPVTLQPGASLPLTIRFTPRGTGARTAALEIVADGVPMARIALSGTGIQGAITAAPSAVDFGDVVVGAVERRSVTLTNSGTDTVTIASIAVTGSAFSIESGPAFGARIAPGAGVTMTLRFAPLAPGDAIGGLTIMNDGTVPAISITTRGRGVQPGMAVSRSSIAFGVVRTGAARLDSFIVRNTGTAPLTISGLAITGANPDAFEIASPSAPFTISPGGSRSVLVRLKPQTVERTLEARVNVVSAGDGSTAIVLSVTIGQGLVAVTSAVAFGTRPAGGSYDTIVIVRNVTSSDMTITSIVVRGEKDGVPGEYFRVFNTAPFVIRAADSADLRIRFNPTGAGAYSGAITLRTDDAADSALVITLNATASPASSVGREIAAGGIVLSLLPIAPNPARDVAEVLYSVRGSGRLDMDLILVDERGEVVRMLDEEAVAGYGAERRELRRLDLAGLPSGMYQVLMRSGKWSVTQMLMVVK